MYTPLLNEAGGIVADLTIIRLAHDPFRVVTGGGMGMRDKKWFVDHLPADGSAQLHDQTSALYTVGVWGPRARDLVRRVAARDDVSNAGFPFGTARPIEIGGVRTLTSRISYVGELGWEIYGPMEQGLRLWDTLWEAGGRRRRRGRDRRLRNDRPAREGVPGPRRRAGARVRPRGGRDGPATGQGRRVRRQVRLPRAAQPPAGRDPVHADRRRSRRSKSGVKRYMLGREPILALDGPPLVDAKGRRSYVTSAGSGPSVGKHLLMSYLPPEQAVVGTKLAVEYFGERYPVTVAVAGSTPLFDPTNERIRS